MPTHKAYTFASPTSPDTNQSLQKSMLSPTLRKNKKSPHSKKNKTLPTHSPTDKNEMTEQTVYIIGMSLEKKEGQLVNRVGCPTRKSGGENLSHHCMYGSRIQRFVNEQYFRSFHRKYLCFNLR